MRIIQNKWEMGEEWTDGLKRKWDDLVAFFEEKMGHVETLCRGRTGASGIVATAVFWLTLGIYSINAVLTCNTNFDWGCDFKSTELISVDTWLLYFILTKLKI